MHHNLPHTIPCLVRNGAAVLPAHLKGAAGKKERKKKINKEITGKRNAIRRDEHSENTRQINPDDGVCGSFIFVIYFYCYMSDKSLEY